MNEKAILKCSSVNFVQKCAGLIEAYSEPCQKSNMELFMKIVNGLRQYLFSRKNLRCLSGSEYGSDISSY